MTDDVILAERLAIRAEKHINVVRAMYGRVFELCFEGDRPPLPASHPVNLDELATDLLAILEELQLWANHYDEKSTSSTAFPVTESSTCSVQRVEGQRGRPPLLIEYEHIIAMGDLGFSFESMAKILGISARTLRRHRAALGLPIGHERSA